MEQLTKSLLDEQENQTEQASQLKEFNELALLFDKTTNDIVKESCAFFVKSITQSMGKVMVKINSNAEQLEQTLLFCASANIPEILVSPAYISTLLRLKKKHSLPVRVYSAIDFPFGENLYKSKLMDVKNSIRLGVDGAVVAIAPSSLMGTNLRKSKRQLKSMLKTFKKKVCFAFSLVETGDEEIKTFFRCVEKLKIKSVLLCFGDLEQTAVVEKLNFVKPLAKNCSIKIFAKTPLDKTVVEYIKSSVELIYSQSADEIAKALLEKFNLIDKSTVKNA